MARMWVSIPDLAVPFMCYMTCGQVTILKKVYLFESESKRVREERERASERGLAGAGGRGKVRGRHRNSLLSKKPNVRLPPRTLGS